MKTSITLEEAIKSFAEDEHDVGLAIRGSKQGYINPDSFLVREAKNGQYSTLYDFQEQRFMGICNQYEMSPVQLKTKLIEYTIK